MLSSMTYSEQTVSPMSPESKNSVFTTDGSTSTSPFNEKDKDATKDSGPSVSMSNTNGGSLHHLANTSTASSHQPSQPASVSLPGHVSGDGHLSGDTQPVQSLTPQEPSESRGPVEAKHEPTSVAVDGAELTHPDLVAHQQRQEAEEQKSSHEGVYDDQLIEQQQQAEAEARLSLLSQYGQAGPMSIASLTNPTTPSNLDASAAEAVAAAATAGAAGGPSPARKKRQCSLCHGWFSNLATHRSTHLSDTSRPHTCAVCGRGFARPNDLFRHQKSHRGDAPFRCPLFLKASLYQNAFGNLEPSCHQNGGFSRCDTYKNHLKAMHFEYPAGTKKRDRHGMGGKCKGCGLTFETADRWINEHIQTKECEAILKVESIKKQFGDLSDLPASAGLKTE